MNEDITTGTDATHFKSIGHRFPSQSQEEKMKDDLLSAKASFPIPPDNQVDKEIGVCVIFNHFKYNFTNGHSPKERLGTDVDLMKIKVYFESIGFIVNVINEAKLITIQDTLRDYASGKHGKSIACFVCFVLTHGNKNQLCANDTAYDYEELYTPFLPQNCELLNGKHKIFVINACQDDPGKETHDPGNKYYTDASNVPIHTPEDDDYLVALSSVPGFTTLRSIKDGSFFIQCLFECLEANRIKIEKEDFVSVLINTGRLMAVDVSRNYGRITSLDPKTHKCDQEENQKQMPIFFTTLREHLFI